MEHKDFLNILVIDIETVSQQGSYEALTPFGKKLWEKKSSSFKQSDKTPEELYFEKAGIYAEFGKVITIGMGYFCFNKADELSLRVKTIYARDEHSLLSAFKAILEKKFNDETKLCAHNGREFDFPYLARRYVINQITVPSILEVRNRKPWEINHIDTLELWKFGDRKNYTSLDLLAYSLNVQSSKSDIDGSMVNVTYYAENDIERIANYCSQDIITTAQVLLKMYGLNSIKEEDITLLPNQSLDEG